jgi:hypothetical protein
MCAMHQRCPGCDTDAAHAPTASGCVRHRCRNPNCTEPALAGRWQCLFHDGAWLPDTASLPITFQEYVEDLAIEYGAGVETFAVRPMASRQLRLQSAYSAYSHVVLPARPVILVFAFISVTNYHDSQLLHRRMSLTAGVGASTVRTHSRATQMGTRSAAVATPLPPRHQCQSSISSRGGRGVSSRHAAERDDDGGGACRASRQRSSSRQADLVSASLLRRL